MSGSRIRSVWWVEVLLASCAAVVAARPGQAPALDWTVTKVVPEGLRGHTSLALDAADRPHIAYVDLSNPSSDSDMKYARWTGSAWVFETVDSSDEYWGAYTCLRIDSTGTAHLAYGHGGGIANPFSGPRYAVRTPSGWLTETVPTVQATGQYTSLALDSADRPHLAYSGTQYDLETAVKSGATWSRQTVHDVWDVVGWTSIALGVDDAPHIAYSHRGDSSVNYAAWTGSSWVRRQIEAGGVNSATELSLALASDGTPFVAYMKAGPKLAVWDGASWDVEQIESISQGGWSLSMALDASDRPHLVYYDPDHALVKYATHNDDGNWEVETIEPGWYNGQGASIAIDSRGYVHVSWYDSADYSLKYAVGVPEPATLGLLLLGGQAALRRRRGRPRRR